MTEDTRRALADVAVVGAVAFAAYLVLRDPPLRRTVFRAVKYGVGTALPRVLWQEVARAWAESASPASPQAQLGSRTVKLP